MKNEVQAHGFTWQDEIFTKIFKVTAADLAKISYTSKMDLPRTLNPLGDFDVSIKTTGEPNAVCMADSLRLYDAISSGEPLHMITIQYKQVGSSKKIVVITEVNLTDARTELFGSLTREQIEELDKAVKAVPKGRRQTADERNTIQTLKKQLNGLSAAIQFNPKCDSKDQRRLQCSFNKFQQFLEENPTRIVERGVAGAFRGGAISEEITSGQRTFAKKEAAAVTVSVPTTTVTLTPAGKQILTRLQKRLAAQPK